VSWSFVDRGVVKDVSIYPGVGRYWSPPENGPKGIEGQICHGEGGVLVTPSKI